LFSLDRGQFARQRDEAGRYTEWINDYSEGDERRERKLPKIFVHATSSLFFIAEPAPVRASVVCSLPNQRLFSWDDGMLERRRR
jgi:hypothetical protein